MSATGWSAAKPPTRLTSARRSLARAADGAGDVVGVGEIGDDRAHAVARLEVRVGLDRDDDGPAVGDERVDDGAAEAAGAAGYKSGAIGHGSAA